jgi:deazaflavin-dependent oxidoreductase (nitroreductase family)
MSDWNTPIIEEFRANAGIVSGPFDGKPLLLLHHVGARTGADRVTPLMYQRLEDAYAIFASKGGADTHPHWLGNLVAAPDVRVEVGSDTVAVRARVADDAEREAIWADWKERFPQFADYEADTDRIIPVVILEPR